MHCPIYQRNVFPAFLHSRKSARCNQLIAPMKANVMNKISETETKSKAGGLSKRESWWYGFFGGMISVLVANGIVDVQKIENVIIASSQPYLNLGIILFVSIVTALIAGFWAMIQRPIHSALIAFQLGIIAPSAIITTLDMAGSRYVKEVSIRTLIAPAHAKNIPMLPPYLEHMPISPSYDKFDQKKRTTILGCIIKSIFRQVC